MRCHTALCKPLRLIEARTLANIRLLPWRRVLSRMAEAPVAAPHAAQVHAITAVFQQNLIIVIVELNAPMDPNAINAQA